MDGVRELAEGYQNFDELSELIFILKRLQNNTSLDNLSIFILNLDSESNWIFSFFMHQNVYFKNIVTAFNIARCRFIMNIFLKMLVTNVGDSLCWQSNCDVANIMLVTDLLYNYQRSATHPKSHQHDDSVTNIAMVLMIHN